jgi:hypothetical protein
MREFEILRFAQDDNGFAMKDFGPPLLVQLEARS